jgi:hypothetical protein
MALNSVALTGGPELASAVAGWLLAALRVVVLERIGLERDTDLDVAYYRWAGEPLRSSSCSHRLASPPT